MRETIIVSIINCIPELVAILVAILSAFIYKKLIPFINAKLDEKNIEITSKQLEDVKEWIAILVDSAYRLDKSGKLQNITKKEYVTEKIIEYVAKSNYNFTDDQLDDIRRAAVVALEQTEAAIGDIVNRIEDEVVK